MCLFNFLKLLNVFWIVRSFIYKLIEATSMRNSILSSTTWVSHTVYLVLTLINKMAPLNVSTITSFKPILLFLFMLMLLYAIRMMHLLPLVFLSTGFLVAPLRWKLLLRDFSMKPLTTHSLRCLGALVGHLRPYNSHKLDFCLKKCVFLVYSSLHKG
jgi:hypothetical protein